MTLGLVLGAALGASLCLLVAAVAPPRPALGRSVERWQQQRAHQVVQATNPERDSDWRDRAGQWLVGQLAQRGISFGKLRADLELIEVSLEAHLTRKVAYGAIGLLLPALLTLTVMVADITPPLSVPLLGGLAMGALFFWVPDLSVVQAATQRRYELRRALSCYLDLVAMSLAGGRGIPEALPTCARIGTGWAFELLSSTIERARLVGDTPWVALADLGKRTDIQELQDLGGALMLVADDGAKVRASLTARASTQRRRQLAEAEGAAERADQSMEMAQVVLFVGFLLFLGFPAVISVLGL